MPTASTSAEAAGGAMSAGTLWTVGHSTMAIDAFLALLHDEGVEALADVRRHAGSRRHPQFSSGSLRDALAARGIAYLPLPGLGGRRDPRPDSPNTAWRSAGYRGYADHMASAEYRQARDRLAAGAALRRTAVMCAEAQWRQCHRQLIADDFKASGWEVLHLSAAGLEPHPWTPQARLVDGCLDYRGERAGSQAELF